MSTTRRITFNADVQFHEISSVYDYTASEISASWYDDNEMEKITQRCFKILHKVESGKSKNSNKYCMRGLESHTTLGSIAKRRNRSAAYTSVLDEQERHWNETEDIRIQAISDAYRHTSSSCQMWAQVVGNRDEQIVEGYLYEDEEEDDVENYPSERVLPPRAFTTATPCSRTRKVMGTVDPFSPISPRSVTIF